MTSDGLTDREDRALRAYTDVLAVEWDADHGVARVVTLSDVYTAVPSEGMHLCPDREYNLEGEGQCKHTFAVEITRDRLDAPEGWLVVEDLDERPEAPTADGGDLPDFADYQLVTDGGHDMWMVVDHDNENRKPADSRSEAEDMVETAREFGSEDVEIVPPGENGNASSDGGQTVEPEVVDHVPGASATPDGPRPDFAGGLDIGQDPLDVLPGWMVTQVEFSDRGDSTTTVNKRGCQVIAEYLGLAVETEAVAAAHETGFEHAYYRATVTKPDGRIVTGHGAARADGDDQAEGEGWKLDMQAETRAYKRAVKNATGGGIEAFAKERSQ